MPRAKELEIEKVDNEEDMMHFMNKDIKMFTPNGTI